MTSEVDIAELTEYDSEEEKAEGEKKKAEGGKKYVQIIITSTTFGK